MNDDSILAVLYLLSEEDLLNTANVCFRLRKLAQTVFSLTKKGERNLTLVHDNDIWRKKSSYLRIFSPNIKFARVLSAEENFPKSGSVDTDLKCIMDALRETKNLEYLEIDMPIHFLTKPFFSDLSKFQNLRTLKLYSNYDSRAIPSFEVLNQLEKLSELVWSFPDKFTVKKLLCLLRNVSNLEKLIVICLRTFGATVSTDHNFIDDESYREMLNIVSKRAQRKHLHVTIVGTGSLVERILPSRVNELLDIKCLECPSRRIQWQRF